MRGDSLRKDTARIAHMRGLEAIKLAKSGMVLEARQGIIAQLTLKLFVESQGL
jgi:hypothetical protein